MYRIDNDIDLLISKIDHFYPQNHCLISLILFWIIKEFGSKLYVFLSCNLKLKLDYAVDFSCFPPSVKLFPFF